jgi:uncharacterized lipoprotein YehR (DUF1307 family)
MMNSFSFSLLFIEVNICKVIKGNKILKKNKRNKLKLKLLNYTNLPQKKKIMGNLYVIKVLISKKDLG